MRNLPEVKDYMTTPPLTLGAEASIFEAIDFLLKHKVSGVAVVEDNNSLIGFISEKDCFNIIVKVFGDTLPKMKVSDVMSKNVETISPDVDIYNAAGIFVKTVFRRLPVEEDGKLIGQISRRGILKAIKANLNLKKYIGALASQATLIEKEEVSKLSFPPDEVLVSGKEIRERREQLERATVLGNTEHTKVDIIFGTWDGLMRVDTTIWATTEKNISTWFSQLAWTGV